MKQRSSGAWGSRRTRAVAVIIASNAEAHRAQEQTARSGLQIGKACSFSAIMQTKWVVKTQSFDEMK